MNAIRFVELPKDGFHFVCSPNLDVPQAGFDGLAHFRIGADSHHPAVKFGSHENLGLTVNESTPLLKSLLLGGRKFRRFHLRSLCIGRDHTCCKLTLIIPNPDAGREGSVERGSQVPGQETGYAFGPRETPARPHSLARNFEILAPLRVLVAAEKGGCEPAP